ncbi:hypothetical protein XENOCAPTIV_030192 [Xenoophorus captivus]|uniref:TROVE domain-containing protein n=1 Tax=Xenoophorus captivus TaxID=1517983 RepID=A0ABV0QXB3_9TELE
MTPQSSSLFPAQPSSLPSLQATSLSSTSSFLLSTDSALLGTQNKLLTTGSAGLGSSLTSTVPSHSLVPLLLAGDPLVNRFADPPSFLKHGLSGEKKRDKGEEDEEISEEMASSYEETSVYLLLNAVCCSLVNKSKPPGQKDWNSQDSVWTTITKLAEDISDVDPQFLLKVAVYTRQELNIRITTNFLLALAASLASTKPHVRSKSKSGSTSMSCLHFLNFYLNKLIILFQCFNSCLPTCLKKAMVDKYPSDVKAFTHSGIKGVWDPDRAGQRMKLKEPQTWERLLSLEGNKAATWEKLIGKNSKMGVAT